MLVLARGRTAEPTHVRFPDIGCSQARTSDRALWRFAPAACQTGGPDGQSEGFAAVRWQGWGADGATGRGRLVEASGRSVPATFALSGLTRTDDFLGRHEHASWYTSLRVIAPHATGPSADFTVDVRPAR